MAGAAIKWLNYPPIKLSILTNDRGPAVKRGAKNLPQNYSKQFHPGPGSALLVNN